MLVDLLDEDGVSIIRIREDRLDARVAMDLKDSLSPSVLQGKKNLVINLANTTFIDSSALGVIVGVLKQMGTKGNIAICNANGPVLSAFKLTRMDLIIKLYDSEEEAKAALVPA